MWDCRAQLVKPHDGDTFTVLADTQYDQRFEPDLRLLDVHAPELRELGGPEATAFVNDWLAAAVAANPRLRWPLYVKTVKTQVYEPTQKKTFDRYLATVWRYDPRVDGPVPGSTSLNEDVIAFLAQHPEWGPGMLPEPTETMTQPDPQPNDNEHVQRRAIKQLNDRYIHGIETYGTGLQVGNGRRMSKDFREELQDALIYATGMEMVDEELVRIISHVVEMHYEFQGVCNICKQSAPCHTRVDLEKTLEILGEIRPN